MGKSLLLFIILSTLTIFVVNFNLSLTGVLLHSQKKLVQIETQSTYSSLKEINSIVINLEKNGYIKTISELPPSIEIIDLSSKINPNFIDFTIFMNNEFKIFLMDDVTWQELYMYRKKQGLVNNIELYKDYFKDLNHLTIHNIPNINNASQDSLEILYNNLNPTNSSSLFIKEIVENRAHGIILTDNNSDFFYSKYNKTIKEYIGTTGTWNVNTIPKELLVAILSKDYQGKKIPDANKKIEDILTIRNSREISYNELLKILNPRDHYKSVITYLDVISTFYQINVKENNMYRFIYKLSPEGYKCISYIREAL